MVAAKVASLPEAVRQPPSADYLPWIHMTNPTPLSPAAQAVLDAYYTEADLRNREVTDHEMLAAALHAAASQLLAVQWNQQIPADTTHQLGINWARDALHALANELEAQ